MLCKVSERINNLFEKLLTVHPDVIILGDFNLNLDDCIDYYLQKFLRLLEACDMNQHVKSDTTHVKGHILDLLITHKSCNCMINSVYLKMHPKISMKS